MDYLIDLWRMSSEHDQISLDSTPARQAVFKFIRFSDIYTIIVSTYILEGELLYFPLDSLVVILPAGPLPHNVLHKTLHPIDVLLLEVQTVHQLKLSNISPRFQKFPN